MVAKRWIGKGYNTNLVLDFVGLAASTFYENISREELPKEKTGKAAGRPKTQFSSTLDGQRIPDEQIKEWLCELICGDGFPYGYKKLTATLVEDYGLVINHKKVYRLCKEMGILKPQRVCRPKHPKRLPQRTEITGPDQLWEMDIKYGYIHGEERFFFQLSLIDVFDRCVIDYHLGLTCTAKDACRVLRNALKKRGLKPGMKMPRVRTDNGPQFIANFFEELCHKLGIIHERIPIGTPNLNAHIEAFHSILEDDCYSRHQFNSYAEAYEQISLYMEYYNQRRRHGSLKNMAPEKYYQAIISNSIKPQVLVA